MENDNNFREIPGSEWTDEVREAVELAYGDKPLGRVYAFGECRDYYSMLGYIVTGVGNYGKAAFVVFPLCMLLMLLQVIKMSNGVMLFMMLAPLIVSILITVRAPKIKHTYVVTDSHFILFKSVRSKNTRRKSTRWIRFINESVAEVKTEENKRALYVYYSKTPAQNMRVEPGYGYIGGVRLISITGISEEEESRVVSVIEEQIKRYK